MTDAPPVVRFHYIKSNAYRVVHADGIIGGPTPSGLVDISFFSERFPIPTVADHEATDRGGGRVFVGKEVRTEGKQGVVREVEVGVMMTLEAAKKLQAWLCEMIPKIEAATPGNDAGGSDVG